MKLLLVALLIASLQSDTTALVEASKEAKAKKKSGTTTTKVITNADVKKSKGKLTELSPSKAKTAEVKPEPSLMEKQAAERTARLATEANRAELQSTIDALEKDVAALEASYFATNDLDDRDNVIARQFAEKKAKLDAAKKQLATLSGAAPASGAEFSRAPAAEAAAAPQKP
ncbi:MAG: hypothetical protein DMF56_09020 [Acidobacteria bacterium]|nr:MAG: hypothetical protein DMF56_09020 [Acidobacteriota bacterium]